MQDYKKLRVWKKSHQLAVKVYQASKFFPREELYGLTSQIRRASVSIPANIAEGCGRGGNGDLGRFLQISLGSTNELEYELFLSHDLKFLENDTFVDLDKHVNEVKGMLIMLITKLKT